MTSRILSKYYTNVVGKTPTFAKIIEVGPRDGLQNEKTIVSLPNKLRLIDQLEKANIKHIEVGSFVNPKLVPQMADSIELVRHLKAKSITYSALVPNMKGFEEGIYQESHYTPDKSVPINEIVLFTAASETFNKKNTNATIAQSFERFKYVVKEAEKNNIQVRGSISCCLGCPYEGHISPDSVLNVVRKYSELGVKYIDIADTIGVGTPEKMRNILEKVVPYFPIERLTGHFHDTSDTALDLVDVCLENGMNVFHSSLGGLGGCPFSPKRAGNLATEKLVKHLHSRGVDTGIDLNELSKTSEWIKTLLKK